MNKLTKMQIKHATHVLDREMRVKLNETLSLQKNPYDVWGGKTSADMGMAEAKKSPKKFLESAIKVFEDYRYGNVSKAFEDMPSCIKARKDESAMQKANEEEIDTKRGILNKKIDKIVDHMYLSDSEEALKMISDFKNI
tara:strand:+ start:2153 stop:2569 length:417 start_codon:yes stop_codon:yes gene_type:complete